MACGSCGGNWTVGSAPKMVNGRTLYQVVINDRVAYQSHNLALVKDVQKRYPGSTIQPPIEDVEPSVSTPVEEPVDQEPVPKRTRTKTSPSE